MPKITVRIIVDEGGNVDVFHPGNVEIELYDFCGTEPGDPVRCGFCGHIFEQDDLTHLYSYQPVGCPSCKSTNLEF